MGGMSCKPKPAGNAGGQQLTTTNESSFLRSSGEVSGKAACSTALLQAKSRGPVWQALAQWSSSVGEHALGSCGSAAGPAT